MTTVTRLAVHTSPRKPYASAPLANNAGSCAFCSALSRGFTPWGGCALRASIPPARPRLSHWLTAPSLTPKATAMSFCFHPCSFRFQARLRRSSRQSADRRCSHTSYSTTSLLLSAEISNTFASKRGTHKVVSSLAKHDDCKGQDISKKTCCESNEADAGVSS